MVPKQPDMARWGSSVSDEDAQALMVLVWVVIGWTLGTFGGQAWRALRFKWRMRRLVRALKKKQEEDRA